MNRALKFRAWTGKEWFYQKDQYLGSFVRRAVAQIIEDTTGAPSSGHESYLPNGGHIEEYLYQYTGLKDKYGQEIYEGDILERKFKRKDGQKPGEVTSKFIVRWVDGAFWAQGSVLGGLNFTTPQLLTSFLRHDEVIGNIHQHPELLKEADGTD